MDKLETVIEKTLQIAEQAMKDKGSCNPKVIIFFRDEANDLETYMIDLSPQKYFDSREEIMKTVGETFTKMKAEKKVRSIDMALSYGEAQVSEGGRPKKSVVMASALDSKGQSLTRFKEIRHYLMPENPEKQFFELQDLEIKGLKHKSPVLVQLFSNFK